jgi:hypothetical protein
MTPAELLRLLLDPDRLAVAGVLASRAMTTKEAVDATGRSKRVVLAAIGDLRAAGLVAVAGEHYSIDIAALRDGMTDAERAILRRFFSGRTLTEIPASRAKRQVLLQRLALEFDVGRRYTEREVNDILFAFHPDWSTLRRHLIDEGFLDREHIDDQNWYWRAGGRVTDLPSNSVDR